MPSLTNPYPNADEHGRIQVDCDPEVHKNIFKVLCGGRYGVRQCIINTLMQKFYAAILESKLPIVYDPDNESRLAAILERCNFTVGSQSTRPRRTNPRPAVDKAQPVGQGHDAGPAHCTSD